MTPVVASIHLYPVKATAGVSVTSSAVELSGLRHDRRWAVVDAQGSRLKTTTHRGLLSVTAVPDGSGALTLQRAGDDPLVVPPPRDGAPLAVDVSRLSTLRDAGQAAADWLCRVLGEPVRLGWQDDPRLRPMSTEHGGTGSDPLSLADTGPLLLTTTASLRRLDDWIAEEHEPQQMAMARFRPNVVIDGDLDPFVEDTWRTIRIGQVEHRFAEHCDRCVVTTIDPVTLEGGKEPIRTLARHRRWSGSTWFGIRVVPLTTGTISVGDTVLAAP